MIEDNSSFTSTHVAFVLEALIYDQDANIFAISSLS
jgi:hypothetical protein